MEKESLTEMGIGSRAQAPDLQPPPVSPANPVLLSKSSNKTPFLDRMNRIHGM